MQSTSLTLVPSVRGTLYPVSSTRSMQGTVAGGSVRALQKKPWKRAGDQLVTNWLPTGDRRVFKVGDQSWWPKLVTNWWPRIGGQQSEQLRMLQAHPCWKSKLNLCSECMFDLDDRYISELSLYLFDLNFHLRQICWSPFPSLSNLLISILHLRRFCWKIHFPSSSFADPYHSPYQSFMFILSSNFKAKFLNLVLHQAEVVIDG